MKDEINSSEEIRRSLRVLKRYIDKMRDPDPDQEGDPTPRKLSHLLVQFEKETLQITKTDQVGQSEGKIQTDLISATAEDKSNSTSEVRIEKYVPPELTKVPVNLDKRIQGEQSQLENPSAPNGDSESEKLAKKDTYIDREQPGKTIALPPKLIDQDEKLIPKNIIPSYPEPEKNTNNDSPVTHKKIINLPNAKVGQQYEWVIDVQGFRALHLANSDETFLTLDESTQSLRGLPKENGDFILVIDGILNDEHIQIKFRLAVIADPRTLWTEKQSNKEDRFWKEDQDFKKLVGSVDTGLLCVGCSKRGRSHAREGSFRDDDFNLFKSETGNWFVGVVADGAGSAKYSRRGSKIIVDTIQNHLPKFLDALSEDTLEKLVSESKTGNEETSQMIKTFLYQSLVEASFKAAKTISLEAKEIGADEEDFLSTLVLVCAKKLRDDWLIGSFSIGDGGAVIFDINEKYLKPLSKPDSGEYAGQTKFLHSSEFKESEPIFERIYWDVRSDFTAIILVTDGISDPKFETDAKFSDAESWFDFWSDDLAKEVNFSRDNEDIETNFYNWLDFWSPGNHDDRTIIVMMP